MSDSDGRATHAVLKNCARILINALRAVKLCGGLMGLNGRISLHKMRRQKFYDLLRNFSGIGYHRLVRVGPQRLGSHHHRRPPIQGKEGVVDEPTRDGFDKSWEGIYPSRQILVMVEFESLAMAQGSMAYVNIKPEILVVHGPNVLNNCIQVPTGRISKTDVQRPHLQGSPIEC
jgi:hypothetical protein